EIQIDAYEIDGAITHEIGCAECHVRTGDAVIDPIRREIRVELESQAKDEFVHRSRMLFHPFGELGEQIGVGRGDREIIIDHERQIWCIPAEDSAIASDREESIIKLIREKIDGVAITHDQTWSSRFSC